MTHSRPTEFTPTDSDGLCSIGCGFCVNSGECKSERIRLQLGVTPALWVLQIRMKAIQERYQKEITKHEQCMAVLRDDLTRLEAILLDANLTDDSR